MYYFESTITSLTLTTWQGQIYFYIVYIRMQKSVGCTVLKARSYFNLKDKYHYVSKAQYLTQSFYFKRAGLSCIICNP